MDLNDSAEHQAFRDQVRAFLKEHGERAPTETALSYRLRPKPYSLAMRDWQKLLVERGYASRTVPREYGGFGAEPDILKSRIIADEFFAADICAFRLIATTVSD